MWRKLHILSNQDQSGLIMDPLRVACNKDSADYWNMRANSIGSFLLYDLNKYFGPLVTVIQGNIMVDPFLLECYVRDFVDHSSELGISEQIEKKFSEDLNIYSDIVGWSKKNLNYVSALSGSAENFNPQSWNDQFKLRVLCGPKGCGKTTLLLFTKSRLEKEISNNSRCIYINLANIGFEIPDLIIRKKPVFEKFAKYITEQLICRLDQVCDDLKNLKELFLLIWYEKTI
jgi:hypothetical protein